MSKIRGKYKHYYGEENRKYVEDLLKSDKTMGVSTASRKMMEHFGLPFAVTVERKYRGLYGESNLVGDKVKRMEDTPEYKDALSRRVRKSKYYLISSAQASSKVNKDLWQNMQAFAEHIGAEILLQPSRYKNPTSLEADRKIKAEEKGNYLWPPELKNHLYAKDIELNKYLTVLMSLKIQPTAKLPLSGTNGFTGDSSAIIPHNKQHLESMPVLPGTPPKLLLTTGTVTEPNFTDTKIGYESVWAHTYGFVLAEIVDNERFFVHQVSSDDSGTFYFLDYKVHNGEVTKGDVNYPSITFGDIHYGETDDQAYSTSIDLAKRLNVENVFLEDVANMHSISHHEKKSPMTLIKRQDAGEDDLEQELDHMLLELDILKRELPDATLHIVESNHPLWLNQWLDSNDWRANPNKKAYLKYAWLVASGEVGELSVVNYLIKEAHPDIQVYTENDSLKIHGYEMLLHGHRGNASSKGSVNQFKGLSTKSISAHSHVPRRYNGALSAGTLTILNPAYVKGLSAWLHSNVVIAENGRATHIHIINGSYTTL